MPTVVPAERSGAVPLSTRRVPPSRAEKAVHSGRTPHQTKLDEAGNPIRDNRTAAEIEAEAQKNDN